jgi:glycosyltransferase involved in cell wall biosynthesis
LPLFYHLPAGVNANVREVIRSFEPDVVHFMFSEWFGANYSVLRQTSGTPHVFTFFYHPFAGVRAALMSWFITRLCRSVDIVHVVSVSAAHAIEARFGVAAEKIRFMPLGVLPRPATAGPVRSDFAGGTFTILSVGRLSASKGQIELVDIFARMVDRLGRHLRLVLVGGDGGMREAIEARISEMGIDELVDMPGYVEDDVLDDYYKNADALCLLSTVESYGLAFLEAMGHGLPVIAYGLAPVREVLTQGALLARPGDTQEAERFLLRVASDINVHARLSQEALELYGAHPSWGDVAETMIEIYSALVPTGEGA